MILIAGDLAVFIRAAEQQAVVNIVGVAGGELRATAGPAHDGIGSRVLGPAAEVEYLLITAVHLHHPQIAQSVIVEGPGNTSGPNGCVGIARDRGEVTAGGQTHSMALVVMIRRARNSSQSSAVISKVRACNRVARAIFDKYLGRQIHD